jgi:hypothetical protein
MSAKNLTDQDIKTIRNSKARSLELARRFNVSISLVDFIRPMHRYAIVYDRKGKLMHNRGSRLSGSARPGYKSQIQSGRSPK